MFNKMLAAGKVNRQFLIQKLMGEGVANISNIIPEVSDISSRSINGPHEEDIIWLRTQVGILIAELLWKNNVIGTKLATLTLIFTSSDNSVANRCKTRLMTDRDLPKGRKTDLIMSMYRLVPIRLLMKNFTITLVRIKLSKLNEWSLWILRRLLSIKTLWNRKKKWDLRLAKVWGLLTKLYRDRNNSYQLLYPIFKA